MILVFKVVVVLKNGNTIVHENGLYVRIIGYRFHLNQSIQFNWSMVALI